MLLIKLIGKTGVCLQKLQDHTINQLLQRIITVLSKRDFVDVLLPWLSALTRHLFLSKRPG